MDKDKVLGLIFLIKYLSMKDSGETIIFLGKASYLKTKSYFFKEVLKTDLSMASGNISTKTVIFLRVTILKTKKEEKENITFLKDAYFNHSSTPIHPKYPAFS